ncbi:MAG: hypothetical protein P9L94_00300 [Candidatus Hinthialibacter antarcticus]|nr:hypothetical protein [Candidatus Hinthialibacter antarcticus]
MKKQIALNIALFLGLVLGSGLSASAIDIYGEELSINVDFTYASKYMWHGFDTFDNDGAFHPSVEFGYKDFYAGVWGAWPDTSGFEDLTEIDFYLGYDHAFFEEEWYSLSVGVVYTYFSFPKLNSQIDGQEIGLSFTFDQLLPIGPSVLVPSYTVYYEWDGIQSEEAIDNGFYHTFALGYDVPIPALLPEQEEQAISLMADVTYGDGPYDTASGFLYATVGASTTFEWNNFYLTPAVYYQFSFDDSVNDEDDLYTLISIGYSF